MAEQNNQEIPSTNNSKKEHSYTYWVDEKNKSRDLPEEHKPKKIEKPLFVTDNVATTGPSKWNSSGTWEQRTVQMKELNNTVNRGLQLWLAENKCQLVLKSVDLQGEFKQVFSNNKRKILYEITGSVKFQGDDLQIKIKDLTCSGDREYEVKGMQAYQKAKLKSIAEKLVQIVVQVFNSFKQ